MLKLNQFLLADLLKNYSIGKFVSGIVPKVSVVMSVYNGEKYVCEAIDSILGQTFSDFEFIIIDDGSIDNSGEIIRSFKDNRIILIQQDNHGMAASWNRGIDISRGKYIARMDDDDVSMPNRFREEVAYLEGNNEYVAVGCWSEMIDIESNLLYLNTPPIDSDTLINQLPNKCPFIHSSVMMRYDYVKQVNGYKSSNRYFNQDDLLLWVDLSKYGKFHNLPLILHKYRVRPGNSQQWSTRYFDYQMTIVREYYATGLLNIDKLNSIKPSWGNINDNVNVSDYYKKIAATQLTVGYRKELARKSAVSSIKYDPCNFKAWLILIITFLPKRVIGSLLRLSKRIKQSFRNKSCFL